MIREWQKRQFCESTLIALRARKTDDEYKILKANATIADEAMQAAWAAMRPGMTELGIAEVAREKFTGSLRSPLGGHRDHAGGWSEDPV